MARKHNPDKIIEAKEGTEVCNFDSLHSTDGPRNLEIGPTYQDVYSTKA